MVSAIGFFCGKIGNINYKINNLPSEDETMAGSIPGNIFVPFILVHLFYLQQIHDAEAAAPDQIVHRGIFTVFR